MARQVVSDQALRRFGLELNERFSSVRQQLTQLNAVIDEIEGKWQGQGAHSFNSQQARINRRMAAIGRLLMRFEDAVQNNRKIAGSTDHEVYQAVQRVAVGDDVGGGAAATGGRPASSLNGY
ncbi:WXG100 family type VII secretion target [Streptomyces triticagri]|uniref:WXG100 family type VII secretion target n=1 Tax=Streptomyces triticagri TaxID=2293568 RepID=A0A372LXF4_9ACTN|nr:WXG100 family type VII secretion target [Streptomyces triticagri]RFU83326.1 WXG100 family type VII secretion target [Streptomyces triticagri]